MTQLEERKKKFVEAAHTPFFVLAPHDPPIFNIFASSGHRALILVSKVAEHQSLYLTS